MPWKEVNKMSLKQEFVKLAKENSESNFTELCKRFEISRTLGYKLLKRYEEDGKNGLEERSKRPKTSPRKTAKGMEEQILRVRNKHWSWGGRKIHHYLARNGYEEVPHPNTITDILRRHGRLYEWSQKEIGKPYKRFERSEANDLWQMDFKGHFPLLLNNRCHPLTVLDDHSRYAIGLKACSDEKKETVRSALIKIFNTYGLPKQINVDNGPPWGNSNLRIYTELAMWMMRLGIEITHSSPHHPQTNGKDERFHRTLKQELLNFKTIKTLEESQKYFDEWRHEYNTERPHEALNYDVPIKHYRVSERKYPLCLPTIEYLKDDMVRMVHKRHACINFIGKQFYVGCAFVGQPLAVRPTDKDGLYNVFYCQQLIRQIDLRADKT
jgi:transposase InsO family protein